MKKLLFMLSLILLTGGLIFSPLPPVHAQSPKRVAPPGKPIELKYADFMPATHWWYADVAVPWLKRIEKASNGRVKITRYPGGTLSGPRDMFERVKAGIVDIGKSAIEYTPGVFPLLEVLGLPGIPFNNCFVSIHAKWETFKALYPKGVWKEISDLKVLRIASTPPFWLMSKKPVRTLKNLKGMEIRASGEHQSNVVRALGAVPVDLAIGDVYIALNKGTIQGILTAPELLKGMKFAEVLSAQTYAPVSTSTFYYVMNLKVWNSLPKDVQKVFEDDADFTVSEEARIEYAAQKAGSKYALETRQDWEIIKLSDVEMARWMKLIEPLAQRVLAGLEDKGLPGRLVWNEIRDQTIKYNKNYPFTLYEALKK